MKRIFIFIVLFLGVFGVHAAPARAVILVDHQPHPYGGGASDTLFPYPFTQPYSQRVADDFTLTQADSVIALNWWGFYNADNPPTAEQMRVRFYDARPSDELPGLVLYEETFSNPARTATGRFIGVGILPREFLFQASLSSPVNLESGTKYWLEVVQIGDISTTFRWETSVSDNTGLSYINPQVVDWRLTLTQGETAFQLISPEPTTLTMLTFGVFAFMRRRGGCGWRLLPMIL